MIFTFWVHDDVRIGKRSYIPKSVVAWRKHFPSMTSYSDRDVIPILEGFGSAYVDLYRRIRIPSCKSDLARLLLLFRFGGLYVDAHIGPSKAHNLVYIYKRLATDEVVLFDKIWEHTRVNDIYLMNGVMCARRSSEIIKQLIESALRNLQAHEVKEHQAKCYVPYNIFVLTGAWDIIENLFELCGDKYVLKPGFAGRVHLVGLKQDEDHGFILYKYLSYRKEGQHWSERQASEVLFRSREAGG